MLIDFADPVEIACWTSVNDGVMGGVSQGGMQAGGGANAVFAGYLSLENNGGFASVRRRVPERTFAGCSGIIIHVRGDGRTYQFRVRTDDLFDGTAYRAIFATAAGLWNSILLPFDRFEATFRGRLLPSAPALSADNIQQVGFLLADRREGPFGLEIAWIKGGDGPATIPECRNRG